MVGLQVVEGPYPAWVYDPDDDSGYLRLDNTAIIRNEDLDEWMRVHYDTVGKVNGVSVWPVKQYSGHHVPSKIIRLLNDTEKLLLATMLRAPFTGKTRGPERMGVDVVPTITVDRSWMDGIYIDDSDFPQLSQLYSLGDDPVETVAPVASDAQVSDDLDASMDLPDASESYMVESYVLGLLGDDQWVVLKVVAGARHYRELARSDVQSHAEEILHALIFTDRQLAERSGGC